VRSPDAEPRNPTRTVEKMILSFIIADCRFVNRRMMSTKKKGRIENPGPEGYSRISAGLVSEGVMEAKLSEEGSDAVGIQ
jgi:hypothetical protein